MKEKVLFINMPVRENAPPNNIPLGPLSLATLLNENGYDSTILDLNLYRPRKEKIYDDLHNIITKKYDNQMIVMLSGLITTLKYQEIVAKIIKSISNRIYLVSGGGLATDIKNLLFNWIPELDAINIGPGEVNITDIARNIGMKQQTYFGKNPSDLDKWFKLDYSLIEVEKYIRNPIWGSESKNSSTTPFTMKRSINSITSKGCIFNCSFCDKESTGGRDYKMRSSDNLIKEMKYLKKKYKIDFLGYVDDNATTDIKRIRDMVLKYKENNLKINWGTHARLDDIGCSKEKSNYLKMMNCRYIGFGGESVNKRVLSLMNKGYRIVTSEEDMYNGRKYPKIYIDALQNCFDNEIHPNLTWIMGYPTETLEELKDTINFILFMEESGLVDRKYNNRNLFVATAYPNTQLFDSSVVQSKIKQSFKTYKDYVYSLSDATKTIESNGNILNYSNIPDDIFMEIRRLIQEDKLEEVMNL